MDIFLIIILFLFFVFTVLFLFFFAYSMIFFFLLPLLFYGAVFAKSSPEIIKKIIFLADINSAKKAVDLGSGDGRLVIAMAKAGAEAHGYEINPFLVLLSRRNIRKAGLSGRAFAHWKNFWNEDFSEFDIVTIYGISYIMKKLEAKLKKELRPNAKVISSYFIFSDWPYSKKEDNIYLYLQK